ncbi:MAG: sigma-54-dependent Fis family transcriptional regulator, partial [Rhodobacteraceae bacterium]|nr:sigma-54-dependent Fis family transcriptional regulator [Paracoccaceae bacterium]
DVNQAAKLRIISLNTNHPVLMSMQWPGNLRQLHNVLERAIILNKQDRPVSKEDILSSVKTSERVTPIRDNPYLDMGLREARGKFEQEYLMAQLRKFDGNISRAADFIGMERAALHRKLKSLGISTQMVAGTRVIQLAGEEETAESMRSLTS